MLLDMFSTLKGLKPMDAIFVGAIIVSIGGAIVAFATWKHNRASSKKSTDILTVSTETNHEVSELKKQNDSLRMNLNLQLNKIDELRQENTDLHHKLANATGELYKNIAGDGNMPVLTLSCTEKMLDPEGKIPSYYITFFSIENAGRYPLRNIRIDIFDMSGRDMLQYGVMFSVEKRMVKNGFMTPETAYKNYIFNPSFDLGSMSPGVKEHFYRSTYSEDLGLPTLHYNISIAWDNGQLTYYLTLKPIPSGKGFEVDMLETVFNGKVINDKSHLILEIGHSGK